MRRREVFLVTLLALASIERPAAAAKPATCPDDASWQGQPPPLGSGYYCARTRPDGQHQRHGWAVLYHPASKSKVEECEYREGVRHGRCTLYDDWGEIQERGTFTNGVQSGPWWYWSLPTATGRLRTLVVPPTEPDVEEAPSIDPRARGARPRCAAPSASTSSPRGGLTPECYAQL